MRIVAVNKGVLISILLMMIGCASDKIVKIHTSPWISLSVKYNAINEGECFKRQVIISETSFLDSLQSKFLGKDYTKLMSLGELISNELLLKQNNGEVWKLYIYESPKEIWISMYNVKYQKASYNIYNEHLFLEMLQNKIKVNDEEVFFSSPKLLEKCSY
jgi:hypothetical protein